MGNHVPKVHHKNKAFGDVFVFDNHNVIVCNFVSRECRIFQNNFSAALKPSG